MDIFKAKLVTYIIAYGLVTSGYVGGILYYFKPDFNWNWFVVTTLFFLIVETCIISMINTNSQKQEKKQLINLYMLTKVIKVIGTLSFITVYVLTGNKNIKSFVAVCISFYLLYLLAETILFIKIEKNIKEKKTRDE
ncbi:MAG: hypothetical protein RL662_353 [Bacteroidota bacterium]